ncbi:NFX1-type zinc finger-containing protein 1 [Eumeta japonica]|uniref:NFX1-type zinc finger-containing protein 1 n=1 Tax=Eumeta variegata TaxID=151549 RepID=A0A4C1UXB2_EUMVA|nr:NFX1-type zinc finger-containing protein 1 [Eumeta japonica]
MKTIHTENEQSVVAEFIEKIKHLHEACLRSVVAFDRVENNVVMWPKRSAPEDTPVINLKTKKDILVKILDIMVLVPALETYLHQEHSTAFGNSQSQRSHQYVAGPLGRYRISDGEENGLMERAASRWRRQSTTAPKLYASKSISAAPAFTDSRSFDTIADYRYRNNQPEKKFFSGERHQHRVGFKFLESILKIDNHDDALNEIMAKKKELFEYLNSPYSLDNCDKYVLLIKVLAKIYDSTFTQMKSELFLEIGKFKFSENLQLYFTNLSYLTDQERTRNRLFWNDPLSFWSDFLTFCECIHTLSPHFAFEKCRPLIDIVTTLCLPAIATKFNINLSEECLQRFENLKKKFSAYEMQLIQKRSEDKHGNYGPAPENFRELEVFPGPEDLLQNKPFLRPNIIDGAYENVEHYLDVQFRLLREDCYGPLRIGIQQFRKDNSKRRYDNIRVYRNVQIIEPMLSNNQFGVLVQWDTSIKKHVKQIKWEQSKRFMFGSLLVFIRNNFRDFVIGTVLDRDVKFLSKGLVVVQLYNTDPCDKSLLEGTYSMLECQVYFEPYLHVLKALQDPEFSNHLAMHEYIVNVKAYYKTANISKAISGFKIAGIHPIDHDKFRDSFENTILDNSHTSQTLQSDVHENAAEQTSNKSISVISQSLAEIINVLVIHKTGITSKQQYKKTQILSSTTVKIELEEGKRRNERKAKKENVSTKNFENIKTIQKKPQVKGKGVRNLKMALQGNENEEFYYIINIQRKHVPSPPAYLRTSTTIEIDTTDGPVNFNLLDPAMWPECHKLSLDESQYEAFKSALTQEFVVIQGPPGTGKTYVGAKIAKTILENFCSRTLDMMISPIRRRELDNNKIDNDLFEDIESKVFDCRLLLLCYTNHALDQFLEHILQTTQSIVRIGGQSRNRNLDQYNITQKRRVEKNSQTFIKMRLELEDANALLATIQNNINIFDQGVYSYETLSSLCEEDVSALQSYPGESSDPLINWLFEYGGNDQIELNPANLFENENNAETEDQAMFNFDDVGINEEKRRFYEKSSSVKASFLAENEVKTLRDLVRIYNDPKQNDAKRYETAQQINYLRRRLNLFQEITNNKDNLRRMNVNSKRHVSQFTLEERWGVYFGWASRIKGSLLKKFQSAKEQQERKFLTYQEARMMMDLRILRRAEVVGVTTTGAARIRKLLQALGSPIVIVEEAAEVLEAHIIAALTKHCQHLILIGDHQQLRPSAAHYKLARHYNFEVSLFERMVRTGASAVGLRLQHRMRPEIAALIAPAIYPDLQNHPTVLHYPPVLGLETSLYFLTHENREEFEEETLSRSNRFEADMMLRLANYIIQQDYSSEDVTILTTYTSQMFYMKNHRSDYPLLKNVKITVVDKYQGEECRIILLSLVRNNTEGEVGFLATDNRVCVALSRAKEGMYIMGNMDILKAKSELWTKIACTLESNKSLGKSLIMKCQQHPKCITEIRSPEDFLKVPEGGCLNKCESNLDCGHGCPLLCHSYDKGHENVKCIEKCNRISLLSCRIRCILEHLCPKNCSEDCGPCDVMMKKVLPCNHTKVIPCHMEPDDKTVRCLIDLTVTLPACGHEAKKLCCIKLESVPCPVKCTERLNCGHTCRRNCHKNDDPDHINYKCKAPCAKTKSGCSMAFADGEDFREHACPKMCYEECDPCFIKVNKVISDCGHKVKVHCSTTPTRKDCLQNCEKILACGHACITKCFQECDCNETTEISTPLLCGHTIVPCQIYLKGIISQDPVQLLRNCAAPCGAVLACGHPCAGTCGRCRQGRLHIPCAEPCGRSLICGHLWELWVRRPHGACSGNAGSPATASPCDERCPLTLPCGHRCRGLCGELCPPLCAICRPDDFPTPLLGDHYEDDDLNQNQSGTGTDIENATSVENQCGHEIRIKSLKRRKNSFYFRAGGAAGINYTVSVEINTSLHSLEPLGETLCPLALRGRFYGLFIGATAFLVSVATFSFFFILGSKKKSHGTELGLFMVLKDCGHFMGVEEADMMMQSEPDGEVHVRSCPTCRKPIINTSRYKDIVNDLFKNEINPIKRKIYGDENRIAEEIRAIEIGFSEMLKSKQGFLEPFSKVFCQNLRAICNYLQGKKKLSLPHVNVLSIVADIFKVISGYVEDYSRKQLTELQNYFLDLCDVLLSAITENLQMISEQQQRDVNNEIKRMRCVLQLATITTGVNYKVGMSTPAVKSAYVAAVDAVTTWRVFDETRAVDALKKLEAASMSSGIVTKEERDSVVRAVGLKGGHWFKCPNGHFYCIGECGGAMERGRCPECGATIGGANHALDPGNQHARELDGSSHPAWSEAANLANYNIDI